MPQGYNKMEKLYRLILKKVSKKIVPFRCLFELTYRCNLSCVHCYCANNDKKNELGKDKIFSVLEELKDAGCLYLTFSGGEILLRKDFFEIAEKARHLNFALRLFTNGTLINEDSAGKIKKLAPLSVEISFYGFRNMHDAITRVKGSFDRTVNGIRLLRKNGVRVEGKYILMRENADEVWKLRKFAIEKLKVEWRGTGGGYVITPCDDGDIGPLSHRMTDTQLEKYMRESARIPKSTKELFEPRKIKKNDILCCSGIIGCNITPQGNLNPCLQIRLKNNSLREKHFMHIWKNHKRIIEIRNSRVSDRIECRKCSLIRYCYLCPGLSFMEKGSFVAKLPEACRQAEVLKNAHQGLLK